MGRNQQSEIKDVGGFVGGYCNNGSRSDIRFRSVLCLDADYADGEIWNDWGRLYGNAAAVYSTHKHTLAKPRLRLVVPLSRNVDPEEYQAIGRRVAEVLGMSLRKENVLQLPGQIYEDIVLTAPPALLKRYKEFEREKVLECLDDDGQIVVGSAAALTNKLLQFANGAIYDMDGQTHELHTIKLDALEELIEEAGGDPVLVLYAYKHDADRIQQRITCRRLDTSADIDAWNRGEVPVALAHPASIGHGLNLQEGGHITIWYGLTWSLELYQQANERLNRPGQTQVCRVYHLVLGGTHDERVLKALKDKEEGQAAAIEALRLEIVKEE